jgi:hypothetical protein
LLFNKNTFATFSQGLLMSLPVGGDDYVSHGF